MIQVTRAQVQASIDEMTRATKKIDEDLNRLEQSTAVHLGEWLGEAREAYLREKQNWDNAIVAMNQVLGTATNTLDQILANYNTTEQRAAAAWS